MDLTEKQGRSTWEGLEGEKAIGGGLCNYNLKK